MTSDEIVPAWALRLEAYRDHRGWNKVQLARQLLRAVGSDYQSVDSLVRQIRKWEKGEHYPRDWKAAYASVFEVAVNDLFPEDVRPATDPEDDVRRRTLLGLLGATAAAGAVGQTEALRMTLDQALAVEPTGRDADDWERLAYDYAHEVGRVPSAQLLPEILTDFGELSGLLARAGARVRPRLIHSAAQLSALIAITLVNLGDHRGARRWWRTASRAVGEAGDTRTASLIRGRYAVFALYAPTPSRAMVISAAQEAIDVARGEACAGVASGYAAKAQALAEMGRHAEASRTLSTLEDVYERLPDEVSTDQRSQWGWSIQRLHHVASHVHTYAGNTERAGQAQDAALAMYPATSFQGPNQVELHRAGCLIRSGDVRDGIDHAIGVLERLPAEHRGDSLLRRTAMTALELAPPSAASHPAIKDAYNIIALPPGDQ